MTIEDFGLHSDDHLRHHLLGKRLFLKTCKMKKWLEDNEK